MTELVGRVSLGLRLSPDHPDVTAEVQRRIDAGDPTRAVAQ